MLFDRDPKWTVMSDKLLARDYVADRAGTDILIPLLWSGKNPQDIPFEGLPDRFVIKANHGCGYNLIVKNKAELDIGNARSQLRRWLGQNFCHDYVLGTAWAYRNIHPAIMVESFLDDHGNVPLDYKFFCFGGKVEMFKLDFDRFTEHSVVFYDRGCHPIQVHEKGLKRKCESPGLPANIHEMIDVAERLANGFDFIRVDLYSLHGCIYFGELTCYPSGGAGPWEPVSYDFNLGAKWRLSLFEGVGSGSVLA